jgi:hypothetical protein
MMVAPEARDYVHVGAGVVAVARVSPLNTKSLSMATTYPSVNYKDVGDQQQQQHNSNGDDFSTLAPKIVALLICSPCSSNYSTVFKTNNTGILFVLLDI